MLEPIDDARHIGGTVSIAIVAVAAHEVYHDAKSAELVRLRHTSLATEAQEFPPLLHVQLASHAAPATFEKELAPPAVDFSAAAAPDEADVARLMELGFPKESCEAALVAAGGDVRAATEALLQAS